jgi:hypothetical protein
MKRSVVVIVAALMILWTMPASAQKSTGTTGKKATASAVAKAAYVCAMHPEVTSAKPGTCPKCNMKLDRAASKESATGKKMEGCPGMAKMEKRDGCKEMECCKKMAECKKGLTSKECTDKKMSGCCDATAKAACTDTVGCKAKMDSCARMEKACKDSSAACGKMGKMGSCCSMKGGMKSGSACKDSSSCDMKGKKAGCCDMKGEMKSHSGMKSGMKCASEEACKDSSAHAKAEKKK